MIWPRVVLIIGLWSLENLRQQQAVSRAYFDAFWLFAVLAIALLTLVLLMKPSAAEKGAQTLAE